MVGGMLTAPLLSLFVIPAIYLVWRRRAIGREGVESDGKTGPAAVEVKVETP
jgi:Cu(I)/Ag(I) efflux system membrane protein CusA/SilA